MSRVWPSLLQLAIKNKNILFMTKKFMNYDYKSNQISENLIASRGEHFQNHLNYVHVVNIYAKIL